MAGPGDRGFGSPEQRRGQEMSGTSTREESGTLGAIGQKAQEFASDVASRAERAWESTVHGTQDMASSVATTAEDAWRDLTLFMRRYPLATFFAGVAIGFCLAETFGRDLFGSESSRQRS